MIRLSLIVLGVVVLLGCFSEKYNGVESLAINPEAHSLEIFELSACVESSRHGMYLRDCASDGRGVHFEFAPGVYEGSEAINFLAAARRGWSPSYKGVLSAKFIGRMERTDSGWVFMIHKVVSFAETDN